MERNRDWKGIAALVLAGLALFVALGGRWSVSFSGAAGGQAVQPQQVIVGAQPTVVPAPVEPRSVLPQPPSLPAPPNIQAPIPGRFHFGPGWRGGSTWGGPFRGLPGILLAIGLIWLGFRLFRRNRFGGPRGPWTPPNAGGYGGPPYNAGPQSPGGPGPSQPMQNGDITRPENTL